MNLKPEVRVIEWTHLGYEGSFTQYTIVPRELDKGVYADLYIVQVATRNNMARAMQDPKPSTMFGPLENMRSIVQSLIENRCEDGDARELVTP